MPRSRSSAGRSRSSFSRLVARAAAALTIFGALGVVRGEPRDPFSGNLPTYESSAPAARDTGSGSASVASVTGAAGYGFSIEVPPGRGGMQPRIGLSYSSQGAFHGGIAAGWSLSGVGTIERDSTAGAGPPRFVAGGARLVAVPDDPLWFILVGEFDSDKVGATPYRAEFDASFTRYGYHADSNMWLARTPDGVTRRYTKSDGVRWYLTREEDVFGNYVDYSYPTVASPMELDHIDYGANDAAGLKHHARVQFIYDPAKTCAGATLPIGAAIDRGTVLSPRRLKQIQTKVIDAPGGVFRTVRQIDLGYDASAEQCGGLMAPMRYLTSISESAYSPTGVVTPMPALTFAYGAKDRKYGANRTVNSVGWPESGKHGAKASTDVVQMDLDGDGWVDEVVSIVEPENVRDPADGHTTAVERCGLSWRKGLPGGGFAASAQKLYLPTALWKHGGGRATQSDPQSKEACTVYGQVFERTVQLGNCTKKAVNVLSYQYVDWNGDGMPDVLTSAWVVNGESLGHELELIPETIETQFPPECPDGLPGTCCPGGTIGSADAADGCMCLGSQVPAWGGQGCAVTPYVPSGGGGGPGPYPWGEAPVAAPVWTPAADVDDHLCPETDTAPERAGYGSKFRWRVFPMTARPLGGLEVARTSDRVLTIDAPWYLPPAAGDEQLGRATSPQPVLPVVIDIDGDGFLDVVHTPGSSGQGTNFPSPSLVSTAPNLVVHRGDGDVGFSAGINWPKPPWTVAAGLEPAWTPPVNKKFRMNTHVVSDLRDFNNDGLADLVVATSTGLAVAWNTGTGFGALNNLGVGGAVESWQTNVDDSITDGVPVALAGRRVYTRRLMDVDADGRPDLVDFGTAGDGTLVGAPRVRWNLGGSLWTGQPRDFAKLVPARHPHNAIAMLAGGSADWRTEADVVDADGDGFTDMSTWNGSKQVLDYDDFSTTPSRVLVSVSNGRGLTTTYKYASFNSAAAQDVPAGAPAAWSTRQPIWVATAMTVTPGGGQPSMTTQYRYGMPVFKERRVGLGYERSRFVGFGQVRTRLPAPNGATGGKEITEAYSFRAHDGVARLMERVEYANVNGALVPASVSRPVSQIMGHGPHQLLPLFDGRIAIEVAAQHESHQCLPLGQSLDECRVGGLWSRSTTTYEPWPSAASPKLYLVAAQEQISSTNWLDARRVESDHVVHYGAGAIPWAYVIAPIDETTWRPDPGGPVWEQTSHVHASVNEHGLVTQVQAWDGPTQVQPATYRLDYDLTTGNLLSATRPEQVKAASGKKTTIEYFGHQVFGSLFTNELGHQVSLERDAGTGAATRTIGPNAKWVPVCTSDEGPMQCTYIVRFDEERWTIDGFGRVLVHEVAFDSFQNGYALTPTERYTYQDAQNLVTSAQCLELAKCADPLSDGWATSQTSVDGAGRVVKEQQFRFVSGQSDAITTYVYDAAGLLTQQLVPDPRQDGAVKLTYTFSHDSLGRITRASRPDGTYTDVVYASRLQQGVLFASRRVIEGTSDGTGGSTTGLSDAYGRLSWVIEHDNPASGQDAETRYVYDDGDQLVEVEQIASVGGVVTVLEHDWLGRRTRIDREGREWRYQYDLDGNMVAEISPLPIDGAVESYTSRTTYDPLGRPLSHTPAPRGLSEPDRRALAVGPTEFTYDQGNNGKGQLTQVVQRRGWAANLPDYLKVTYSYEANGLPTKETRSFNPNPVVAAGQGPLLTQSVTRAYNAAGLPISSTWDDGQSWFVSYDRTGLPRKVEYATTALGAKSVVADYASRSITGAPRTRTALGNQVRTWTYDSLGRPVSDALKVGASSRFDRTYSYTQSGDVKSVAGKNYTSAGAIWADAAATFTYDKQHRLKTAVGPSTYTASLAYSPTGNILSAQIGGPAGVKPRNVQYDYADSAYGPYLDSQAVNELRVTGTQTPWATFRYDASGNMIERNLPLGLPMNLAWDGDDQLLQVWGAGTLYSESYHYDHTGQRVWAVAGGKVRFWFGESETEVLLGGGTPTYRYISVGDGGGGVARAERIAGAAPVLEMHYADALSNLVMALGASGAVEASFLYGAFGEVVKEWEPTAGAGGHRARFNGKEDDLASGLRYYGFRSYDPIMLRWISGDPLLRFAPEVGMASQQQHNLYSFSSNNPVRRLDPNGLADCDGGMCIPDATDVDYATKQKNLPGGGSEITFGFHDPDAPESDEGEPRQDPPPAKAKKTAFRQVLEAASFVPFIGDAIDVGLTAWDFANAVADGDWSAAGGALIAGAVTLLPGMNATLAKKGMSEVAEGAASAMVRPGREGVEGLVRQMNKRPGTVAEIATGDADRYLKAIGAEGSHTLLEDGTSHILLRGDVATRRTALHEWVHRSLQRRAGTYRPGEDAFIESFLDRHKRLFGLE